MEGFKVFDENFCCRGFQYEVGKTYEFDGEIEVCSSGFYFCPQLVDCYSYKEFEEKNKIARVVALGDTKTDDNKIYVTNKIKIVSTVTWEECLKLVNTGHGNTGHGNTGHWNTGHGNTGHRNTGHENTGHGNTGDGNTGYRNTGHWNKCNNSSGVLCTKEQKIFIFDEQSDMTLTEWRDKFYGLFDSYEVNVWINEDNMSDQEKIDHPKFYVQGGYLKSIAPEKAWENWYNNLNDRQKSLIKKIPNFDAKKFKYITGIKIE